MDRLTQMATFVKTVELGSFSAAADDLNLSPQLVGKQVKMLEQHLGVSLLHRTTRRQSLTDFGRAFYPRAKLILADMQSAENLPPSLGAHQAAAFASTRRSRSEFARFRHACWNTWFGILRCLLT